VQASGLQETYRTDPTFALKIKQLGALAFLPAAEILDAFAQLKLWSMYVNVQAGIPRTQNTVDAWHRRWGTLVGSAHPGLYAHILKFELELANVEGKIEGLLSGTRYRLLTRKVSYGHAIPGGELMHLTSFPRTPPPLRPYLRKYLPVWFTFSIFLPIS
jgi:hypothetical protein